MCIAQVEELAYGPASQFVGTYGGGDAMAVARSIVCVDVPAARIPKDLKARVVAALETAHGAVLAVPAMDRIPRVPATAVDPAALTWLLRCSVSSHVYGAADLRCNVMSQALLFKDVVTEPGRLGASKWPYVGLFDVFGVGVDAWDAEDCGTGAVNPAAGVNALHPSDQHVHTVGSVAGVSEWHAGSDMSRFHIEAGCAVAKVGGWVRKCRRWVGPQPTVVTLRFVHAQAWAVCADLESNVVEVSLLLIVAPEVEAKADDAARVSADGADTKALFDAIMEKMGPCGAAPFGDELKSVLCPDE